MEPLLLFFCRNHAISQKPLKIFGGSKIRTYNIQIMSLTSYQLLYPAHIISFSSTAPQNISFCAAVPHQPVPSIVFDYKYVIFLLRVSMMNHHF